MKEGVKEVGMTGIETVAGNTLDVWTVNGTERRLEVEIIGEKTTSAGTEGGTNFPTGIEEDEGTVVTGAAVAPLCLAVKVVTDPEVPLDALQCQVTSRSCWISTAMRATVRLRILLTAVSI